MRHKSGNAHLDWEGKMLDRSYCLYSPLNQPSVLCPRAAESSASHTFHPKLAKMDKAFVRQHAENGECATVNQDRKELRTMATGGGVAAATPATQQSGGRNSKQHSSRQAGAQEEDPERMKHSKTRAAFLNLSSSRGSGIFFSPLHLKAEDCSTLISQKLYFWSL